MNTQLKEQQKNVCDLVKSESIVTSNLLEIVNLEPIKSTRKDSLSSLRINLMKLDHTLHYTELLLVFNELENEMNNLVLKTSKDETKNKSLKYEFDRKTIKLLIQATMISEDSFFIIKDKLVIKYASNKQKNKSSANWSDINYKTWINDVKMVNALTNSQNRMFTASEFYKHANELNRCFDVSIITPDLDLSNSSFGLIQHQLKYRLQPSEKKSNETNYINLLINSIAGGKEENEKYIKEWLAWTIFHPEDNAIISAINIYGAEGSGKGIFSENLLPTIICNSSVTSINLSNFNGLLAGSSCCILNELTSADKDRDAVKQLIGAKYHRIEKKGVDAYMAEATACYLMFSNSDFASAYLSRNPTENRRFSIINCAYSLDEIITINYRDISNDEIKVIVKKIVKACNDRDVVASWLTELKTFLPEKMPTPLHGKDYLALLNTQADLVETVMDKMMEIGDVLPLYLIKDVIEAVSKKTNSKLNAPKTLNTKIKAYAKRHELIIHDKSGSDNRLSHSDLAGKKTRSTGYSKMNSDSSCFDIIQFYESHCYSNVIKGDLIKTITDAI